MRRNRSVSTYGLTHVALAVRDRRRSLRFYQAVLGVVAVSKVRSVRFVTPEVAILSVAGMVPPGQSDINPAVNAIQTLVAVKRGSRWSIALFQNTPAAFHGRPELSEKLTQELQAAAAGR